ncbi:MAG: hypothetical protein Q9166_007168, partial [cf. Caloplaca sp. 2 TL-2023]
ALVVPFFGQRTLHMDALRTAWIAEVALNLFGIIFLILHYFLRSNADRMAIQPIQSTRRYNNRLRLFGPSDPEMTMHITSPVLPEKDEGRYDDDNYKLPKRKPSHAPMDCPSVAAGTRRKDSQNTEYMSKIVTDYPSPVRSPPHVFLSPCTPRKGSNYSIFPTFRSAMLRNSISTTFSQEEDAKSLQLPKPLAPCNHKREFSEQTSATVHIGFRLSNMSDAQRPSPLSPTASSCCLPLKGLSGSFTESPPISPLSSRPGMTRVTVEDTVIVPAEPPRVSHDEQLPKPRLNFQAPNWQGRRQSPKRSEQKRDRPLTMKALPPIPSIDGTLGLPDHPIPNHF